MFGGGGVQPHFCPWKNVFSHFFPWGKKYMEREGNEYFSLSFHILFSHFSPWGKMGKHTFFHGQKWGWTPPPHMFDQFLSLSKKACFYLEELMKKHTEYLWEITLKSQLQLDGQTRVPKVSCDPIKIPIGTNREEEVKFLSMFNKNNLLNGFLFTVGREKYPSPLCECQLDDQTAFHILTSCEKVDADIREVIILMLLLGNDVASADTLAVDNISLLNCSRDELFVQQCLKTLKTSSLQIRITLSKKGQMCGQPKP